MGLCVGGSLREGTEIYSYIRSNNVIYMYMYVKSVHDLVYLCVCVLNCGWFEMDAILTRFY